MSLINKEVSDFKVNGYYNDEFKEYKKEDILGKWSVFFFYPADEEFKKAGCEVFAVSCDTHFVHKAWHDSSELIGQLTYPMLGDPTHALAKDFEVFIEADGIAERGTFIINPQGRIVSYEVNAGNVGRNAEELLRKLQACQFVAEHGDEVCPARWKPGAKTLKPGIDLVGKL